MQTPLAGCSQDLLGYTRASPAPGQRSLLFPAILILGRSLIARIFWGALIANSTFSMPGTWTLKSMSNLWVNAPS